MKHRALPIALTACLLLAPIPAFARGGGGAGAGGSGTGGSSGTGSGGASVLTGGTGQSGANAGGTGQTGAIAGGVQQGTPVATPNYGTTTSQGATRGSGYPLGVGTAPNGMPIGSPGSGKGSPEDPW